MLMDFFIWWTQQMSDLLTGLLGGRRRYTDAMVARIGAGGVSVFVRRRGKETLVSRLDVEGNALRPRSTGREAMILALDADALLEQSATLPLAAERDLAAVLRFEMDRFTPFRAEDLFWSWRIDRRDRANGLLILRVLLVPKVQLQAALARLAAAGWRPEAVEVTTSTGVEHMPLSSPETASGTRRSAVVASWVCAVLVLAACLVPVWRQERAIAQADATIEALRPRVALVDGLRRRIAANANGTDLFAAEVARLGNPLRALAAVTAALPDDTYLTNFAMHDRKLSIAGRSAGAARLIGALSNDPDLRDPTFDAPVTRVGDRSDLFSIQVNLAP